MMKTKKNVALSIIIPAYHAEKFIADNIRKADKLLKQINKPYEIICIIDGYNEMSGNAFTKNKAEEVAEKLPEKVSIISYAQNRGKGYAVRYGMKKAQGELIGFIDAGRDIEYNNLINFIKLMENPDIDVVIGSKRHPGSKVEYPLKRKLFSYGYQTFIQILFNLPIQDTQVGLKLFRKKVIKAILPYLTIDGFAFDIELLSLIHKMNYLIIEAPVTVKMEHHKDSTVLAQGGFVITSLKVLLDTIKVFKKINSVKLVL